MKRGMVVAWMVMIGLWNVAAGANDPPAPVRKVYDCHFAPQPPTIDGDLSDPAWQAAPWATIRADGRPASSLLAPRAEARLLWDHGYLYFAARIHDDTPRAVYTQRDQRVWEDDCFELYLSPWNDTETYYEIDVNAHGAVWDSMAMPNAAHRLQLIPAWSPHTLEVRTRPAEGGWSVEGRVGFDDLVGATRHLPPHHGDRWPMNLFALDAPAEGGLQTMLKWNPTSELNDISRFGELRFVDYAGETRKQRQLAVAQRVIAGRMLEQAAPLLTAQGSARVWSPKLGDYPRLDEGTGWQSPGAFGRVTVAKASDTDIPAWRMQPNRDGDPTLIDIPVVSAGTLVLLGRLHPRTAEGIHDARGDGVWLTLKVDDQTVAMHLLDSQWRAEAIDIKPGQQVRLAVDAGPLQSHSFDLAQVALHVLPGGALDVTLPQGWSAFGAAGLVLPASPADDMPTGAIHVRASDHFTGATRLQTATPGARLYRITGQMRSDLQGLTRAHVGIDYLDAQGKLVRQAVTRSPLDVHLRWGLHNVGGKTPWTRFVAYAYDPPPELATLSVWLGIGAWPTPDAAGEAWFADIDVQPVTPDPRWPLGFPPLEWTADPATAPPPAELDFSLRATPTTLYQLPAMPPRQWQDDRVLEAQAWPGSSAAASFTLHPCRDVAGVRFTLSDLQRQGGDQKIAASAVDLRQVRVLYRKRHMMSSEYLLSPTHLEPVESLDLRAGLNQQMWLTVHVPADAAPGRYVGTVRVQAGAAPARELSLQVDVAPVVPPPTRGVFFGTYCYYLPNESPQQLQAMFTDMRSHGMTTAFVFNGNLEIPITVNDGRAVIQWTGRNQLAELLQAYGQAKFSEPMLLLAPHAFEAAARSAGGDDGSYGPGFAAAYRDLVLQVQARIAEQNWPPLIIAPYDEGYPYPFADVRFSISRGLIPPLQAAAMTVAVHSLNHPLDRAWRFESEFQWAIDVILPTFCHPPGAGPTGYRGYRTWEQYRDALHSEAKRVVFYNPDVTGVHPEALRFAYGVGLWKLRGDGMINWHYYESQRDGGYGLSRRQGGDSLNLIFPPMSGHAGGPTLGWEATRQGAMDYQALAAVEQAIAAALTSTTLDRREQARQAQQQLEQALSRVRFDSIDPVAGLALPNRWEREEVDGQFVQRIFGQYKLDNGLTLEDYDALRRLALHWLTILGPADPPTAAP